MKKLAFVGCGKLADIVINALIDGFLPDYALVGVMSRSKKSADAVAEKVARKLEDGISNCAACSTMEELLQLKPDYIVESASPVALTELAIPALSSGASIIALSIGAFADVDFYEKAKKVASENGTKIYLVSGAIGGFDVLRTTSLMSVAENYNCTASFDTEKGPNSLKDSNVYTESLQENKKTVFKGNAIEAIKLFPTKVNVAVAASLASVGPENMKVSITSIPNFVGDRHHIEIKNDQVKAIIDVYSETAQIAAWSVVNTLQNISSPVVFS
ncbi:MAG: DUF108 domain-containing protein [Treponema sp.]|nr:DUF108 domain-containing protein [Treponema sp.]